MTTETTMLTDAEIAGPSVRELYWTDHADSYHCGPCPCGSTCLRLTIATDSERAEVYCYGCHVTRLVAWDWDRYCIRENRVVALRALEIWRAFEYMPNLATMVLGESLASLAGRD